MFIQVLNVSLLFDINVGSWKQSSLCYAGVNMIVF